MKYEITKGSEKDFEGAPEWATECVWNDKGSESFCYWLNPKTKTIFNPNWHSKPDCWNEEYGWRNYIKSERRPITEPVFSVECLPPVGARIQYSCIKFDENRPAIEFGKWYGGTVIAYHEGFVWTSDNGIRRLDNTIFRPIRSPEDVARDEAIAEMRIIGYTLPAEIVFSKEEMAGIYDAIAAGKIPGINLSGK